MWPCSAQPLSGLSVCVLFYWRTLTRVNDKREKLRINISKTFPKFVNFYKIVEWGPDSWGGNFEGTVFIYLYFSSPWTDRLKHIKLLNKMAAFVYLFV